MELVNGQVGQFSTIRALDPRNAALNYLSYSCRDGANQSEHDRCTSGPERPIPGIGLPTDDLAPRCICDHHRTVPVGQVLDVRFE